MLFAAAGYGIWNLGDDISQSKIKISEAARYSPIKILSSFPLILKIAENKVLSLMHSIGNFYVP